MDGTCIFGERGLVLSDEKTLITPIEEGFDFLSFNFREYPDGKFMITPSKKAVKELRSRLSEMFRKSVALTQDDLIVQLNKVIQGWGNYHRHNVSSKVFSGLDNFMFDQCVRWARHRHPNKPWAWIRKRYWHRKGGFNWCFCTGKRALKRFDQIGIRRHVKVRADMNPYLDTGYFMERRRMHRGTMRRQGKVYDNPFIGRC